MQNMNVIKMSHEGRIVIPSAQRNSLMEGHELIIVGDNESFSIKKNPLSEKIKDDLEFARRTEEAWKSHERGEFISQPVDEFLADLERC